ncbi:phospholipase D1-like isoform X2 [Asterias amurensis]|uniref:phospholipase D1-like isoform X2 n=1 Tax=Asterias amurensis TaxID=7602 RepID=UPI003AB6D0CD
MIYCFHRTFKTARIIVVVIMDATNEPTLSSDDGRESIDADGNCIINYGTFNEKQEENMDEDAPPAHNKETITEETNGEAFSNDSSKQSPVPGDSSKTKHRYRKRGDSGAALLKATNRSTPQDTNNSNKDTTRDNSGDKDKKSSDEEESERSDNENVVAYEANVTVETVISEEENERDPSTVSATSDETANVDTEPRSHRSLRVMITNNEERTQKIVVPPEQLVMERLWKDKEEARQRSSCDETDCETRKLRANSKNVHLHNNQSISRPTNLQHQVSLFSDQASDTNSMRDWEWIEEPDQADGAGLPTVSLTRSFKSTHFEPKGFREVGRMVFLPNQKLEVTVVDCGRSSSSQFLNPNIYFIEVNHGACVWTIQRRSNDFLRLHEEMLLYKARLHLPIGDKSHLERWRTFRAIRDHDIARFPKTPDALVRAPQLPKRMHQYEVYLKSLVRNPLFRNHPQMLEFLEVSHLSFVDELGPKGKEGWVQKRSGGRRVPITRCCPCLVCKHCTTVAAHYSKRWLITKDSFVAYVRPRDGHVRAVMLADQDFDVQWGVEKTGVNKGITISNQYRKLLVKCDMVPMARQWMVEIMEMISQSEYKDIHRFNAFGPERPDTYARWFVDGSKYFEALADALEEAEQEIFITDWWLNAEIYLKRPAMEGPWWRLDHILKRKAAEGVKIFVLLYKELEVALDLGSKHTKHVLTNLHPNIKVMRHPDHNPGQVFLWAHHEKLVAIDQKVAFVGGLDICYGRWDDFKHRLTDVGSALVHNKDSSLQRPLPPPSPMTPPFSPDKMDEESGGYFTRPRLKSATVYLMNPIRRLLHEEVNTDVADNLDKLGLPGNPKLWIGKDYCNFIAKDVMAPAESLQDGVDRMNTPRMPWHDIGTAVYGKAATDVARHFIQRWNFTKKQKAEKLTHYPLLLPKSTSSIDVKQKHKDEFTPCKCQLLRSASKWSVGIHRTEDSIHQAYINLITHAKHYIYIENQFFITIDGDTSVTNGIAKALYERILRAHDYSQTFRVYVFLPLLPAFQGDVGEAGSGAIHAILHWEYKSICRGHNSLIGRLKDAGIPDPQQYITFYGLRTHDSLGGELVTELVYIHSKLMIVDDRSIICGSANINDRSMLGKRDSELAVLIEDTEMIPSRMNGEEYMAGKLGYGLREWLFKEHLGVLSGKGDIDMTDPVCDAFYQGVVMNTATKNTDIYEKVFRCLPSDKVTSSAALHEYKKVPPLAKKNPAAASRQLKGIRGFITWIPLDFLKNENLEPHFMEKEGIAPSKLWT